MRSRAAAGRDEGETTMTDPFGGDPFADSEALDGDDPFDSASSAFVQPEVLDGRLILIMPKRLESKKGKNGDPYDAIFGDVVVLSGQPADKIDAVPTVLEDVMWSSGFVVSQLRPKLARKRPVLGVLNSRPSTYNRQVRAY